MSEEKMNALTGGKGRYSRPEDAQAIRNRDEAWQEILREEKKATFEQRKRRVALVAGLVLVCGMLLAMIHNSLIDQLIGEVFLALAAAGFGIKIGQK